ncbi:MAG: hypothetical protein M0R17_05285 [Candidatus Omnitrophica bacterium]|jgi:hypothetical protein|nr:hypothetical protein [Candidatus Omnitrophota bacterium]
MKYCSNCKYLSKYIRDEIIDYRYIDGSIVESGNKVCLCDPKREDYNNWEYECVTKVLTVYDPRKLNVKNDCQCYRERWIYRIIAFLRGCKYYHVNGGLKHERVK